MSFQLAELSAALQCRQSQLDTWVWDLQEPITLLLRALVYALGDKNTSNGPASMLAHMVVAETGTGLGKNGKNDIASIAGPMAIGRHLHKRIINAFRLEAPPSPMPHLAAPHCRLGRWRAARASQQRARPHAHARRSHCGHRGAAYRSCLSENMTNCSGAAVLHGRALTCPAGVETARLTAKGFNSNAVPDYLAEL
ncbi:hypothetical protein PsYK624_149230 [Phanerochaete sordida]|uniref:Uncharacterized protein n=1 Tax=Phanerochaete sordida TaxID=48140 RepID=A0A9P3GMU1_9APHY|nr:hypothetical protein PsYK624_149230 [Phanerochaete sordida]